MKNELIHLWRNFMANRLAERLGSEDPTPETVQYIKDHATMADFMDWLETRA